MTRRAALTSMVAPSRRLPVIALAATALAAVALAACGTQKTSTTGSPSKPADALGAQRTEATPGSDQQAAFTAKGFTDAGKSMAGRGGYR
ncbi:hypothetical protein [Streptomyces rishiriensis]|uniref:hypothetical protein n=1 Tax=Streptomyces rishiriensis TaxID=68264 RepID=UPI0037D11101